jgi:hypothetical protein
VDDLARALEGKEILVEPNCPFPGVMVAMTVDDGAPIELLEFRSPSDHRGDERRQGGAAFTSAPSRMKWHPIMSVSCPTGTPFADILTLPANSYSFPRVSSAGLARRIDS